MVIYESRREVKAQLLLSLIREGFIGKNAKNFAEAENLLREWGSKLGMKLTKFHLFRQVHYRDFTEERWIARYDTGQISFVLVRDEEGNTALSSLLMSTEMPALLEAV
jgi:hypothetical protein